MQLGGVLTSLLKQPKNFIGSGFSTSVGMVGKIVSLSTLFGSTVLSGQWPPPPTQMQLHSNFVLFSARAILLSRSDDITSVQLSDFSYSITISQIEDDYEIGEVLRESLPVETIPPEVCSAYLFGYMSLLIYEYC